MRTFAFILLCLVIFAAPIFAADDAAKAAALKGAEYLRKEYAKPDAIEGDTFKTGGVALVGLALLEAGIKADDPAVANISKHVRSNAIAQSETYHLTMAILFLDKLAEKTEAQTDRALIQLLGVRLYAGMNASGGWGYGSWEPLNDAEVARWKAALEKSTKPDDKLHPEVAKLQALVVQTIAARGRANDNGDNSNTQFGMIGLWIASRYGVSANDAFAAVESRFLRSWHKTGGWSYVPDHPSSVAMTCAGLLGFAVGEASRTAVLKNEKPAAVTVRDDPFFNPQKPAEVRRPPANAAKAELIKQSILALGQVMAATNIAKGLPPERPNITDFMQPYTAGGNLYYLLWSVERCAVAYGLDSFADIDWYVWGCRFLFKLQSENGAWGGGPYPESVNTSFAILFLMKANSFRDLSNRMAGRVKDPGTAELRNTVGTKPLFDPATKPVAVVQPKKETPAGPGGFALPPAVINEKGTDEEAVRQLLAAKDAEWPMKLAAVRDGKGAEFTRMLVQLAALSEGERKRQAREFLAERLTRMTPKTLRDMVQDIEPELRRGACLACGMKELEESIPWLIARLSDPSDSVAKAAHASLKSLSGADHGPASGANEDERLKAVAAWRAWYEKRGK